MHHVGDLAAAAGTDVTTSCGPTTLHNVSLARVSTSIYPNVQVNEILQRLYVTGTAKSLTFKTAHGNVEVDGAATEHEAFRYMSVEP